MTDWHVRYRALLLRGDGSALLGVGEDLPFVELAGERDDLVHYRPEVAAAFARLLAAPVEVLRVAHGGWDEDRRHGDLVVELATPDAVTVPGSRWIDRAALATLPRGSRGPAAAVLDERATGAVPRGRPPWADPGWRSAARAWIAATAERAGRQVRRLEVRRDWALSIIWRAELDVGGWYVKAGLDLPRFVDEGTVSAALAEAYPGHVPPPIAHDPATGLFVTEDLGDVVGWDAPASAKISFARSHAALQRRTTGDVERLLAAGCLDRRAPVLAADLERLLADPARSFRGLASHEVDHVRSLLPALRTLVAEADDGPVPPALVHGDAHLGNAVEMGGGLALIDWTDACVAHPFIDGHLLASLHGDEGSADAVRDATLEAWSDVAGREELCRTWARTAPVALLHHIVSYDVILGELEPVARPDLSWAVPRFWRELISALEGLSPSR